MISHSTWTGLVGAARADITPSVGIFCRNWGAAVHDTAQGIHRPLFLTAIAIQENPSELPLVLVDLDLGWWGSLTYERAFRQRITSSLGLPAERFLWCVTHTHAAPPLSQPEPQWPGGDILSAYLVTLEQVVIETARKAIAAVEPATIDWHHGRCALATNRDLPDPSRRATQPSGAPRIVCGYNPAIPADDTLVVGRVTAASGRLVATLTNYACHPTTLAWDCDLVSPDFVGAMRETIQEGTGGAPAIFLQGASGELSPRYQYVGDPAVADAHGRELGHAALATIFAMEPSGQNLVYDRVVESGAPLATWRRETKASNRLSGSLAAMRHTVSIPLKDWPPAAELASQFAACSDRAMAERLRRKLRIREALGDGAGFPIEIWGWRLGEALVLGTLAEAYSCIQQHVRAAFPERQVVWLNLVNGCLGYLPPAGMYDVDLYQVWQTPFDRGSLELVEQAAIALGHELLATSR